MSAIPHAQSWEKLFHFNSGESTTPLLPICTITYKMLYDKLLTLAENLPVGKKKNLLSYDIAKENPNHSYFQTFKATKKLNW